MNEVRIKIIIEDEQLDTLRKSAHSTFDDFIKGFEVVGRTADTTFYKFNRVAEDNFKKTKSTFDKLYGGDDIQSKLLNLFTNIPPLTQIKPILDIIDEALEIGQDLRKAQENRSVVKDIATQPIPKIEKPVDLSFLVNPPLTKPVNFGELLKEQDRKRIQEEIERLESEGKTIEDLAVALRDALQKDLDNFGKMNGFEVPQLEVRIPDLKLQESSRKELLEQISLDVNNLDLSLFPKSIQNATDQQLRDFLALRTAIKDLDNQYMTIRASLEAQAVATKEGTKVQSEYSTSIENVIKNTSEGAVIFGFTKEELLGLRDVTDEATKSTENLGKNGVTAVTDNAKEAGKTLGNLDLTLENVGDKARTLDKTIADGTGGLEGYEKVVEKVDTAANSAADGGLTNLEGKVEDVSTAASNLNLAEAVKDLAGFDPSKLPPGFIKPFIQAKEQIKEFGDTIEQVENQGGFFEGIKQGFIDFVESVESNSELMADFFADTLSQMSQNFSDLFYNVLTGKFDDLKDLAKQAFEAILRAFLDLVSAIATRQIVISIGGLFGIGKGAQAAGGGGNPTDIAQQGAGVVGSGLGLFGAGGAFETLGAAFGGGLAGVEALPGAASLVASSELTALATPGFLATASAAITVVGAVLAAAALAFTIIAPLLEKTPRLDIDFDSVKTEAGRRAALVSELLDDDFLKDEIIDISVKRKAGLGLGGDEGIKDVLADAIQVAVNNLLDIINKLPTDLADTLTEELLNTPLDTETEVAGERLLEFDAKGKKIGEKFNQLINGEIQAKFLFAVDGFLQTMFESLGVLPEAAEAFLDERFEEFKNAGSREARAKVGQELLADINAFVDAFNIVSGNVNDAIGQTIQEEDWEYRLAA